MSDVNTIINDLKEAGAQFAYSKSKRHPSTSKYIAGRKDTREIFNLEETAQRMQEAKEFVRKNLDSSALILFVGTKNEARAKVKEVAERLSQPYVSNRFIGGTLTNFTEIRKRINHMKDLRAKFAAGELKGYTKKEKLLLERELKKLEEKFGGLEKLERLPQLLVIVDPCHEDIALKEAKDMGIKVLAIANNDCDYSKLDLVIPANDANSKTISYILDFITA